MSSVRVLIALSGGSGSGKSDLADALVAALGPGIAQAMSEDWYYRDLSEQPGFDPALCDFDDLTMRDHALLRRHLKALRSGRAIKAPRYDFESHRRLAQSRPVAPTAVVVVEGAHLLCRRDLAALFDLKIYLDAPADIRFIRRLLRDQRQRGRSPASVVNQYLATVRPAHERLTEPSRAGADLVLDDRSHGVESPDPAFHRELLKPVLNHPLLQRLAAESCGMTHQV
jgi:uridine kinase